MRSARQGRRLADVLVVVGLLLWSITVLGLTLGVAEEDRTVGVVAGVVGGALIFLSLYVVAVVLRLLSDIADGVNPAREDATATPPV